MTKNVNVGSNVYLMYATYSSDKFTAKDKKLDILKHLEISGSFDTESFDAFKKKLEKFLFHQSPKKVSN